MNAVPAIPSLMSGRIYGDVPRNGAPPKSVLERVHANGKICWADQRRARPVEDQRRPAQAFVEDYSIRDVRPQRSRWSAVGRGEETRASKSRCPTDLQRRQWRRANKAHPGGTQPRPANAIKFTDSGEVVIQGAASNGHYKSSVQATGPRHPPSASGEVFAEFRQADSSRPRKGRHGLGPRRSNKRIVGLHGGRHLRCRPSGQRSTLFRRSTDQS